MLLPHLVDGEIDGTRVRRSTGTRDWARATRNLGKDREGPAYGLRECAQPGCTELVDRGRCERHTRDLPRAIMAYHNAHQDASHGTRLSRVATLNQLQHFLVDRDVATVDQVDLETLNSFRTVCNVSPRTWTKELGTLRHFFRFCLDNEWILRSWADKVKMPRNLKPVSPRTLPAE